jgi:hypothetical protein
MVAHYPPQALGYLFVASYDSQGYGLSKFKYKQGAHDQICFFVGKLHFLIFFFFSVKRTGQQLQYNNTLVKVSQE